jgi:hypothetical protein
MSTDKTVFDEHCYVTQGICKHKTCKKCDELKQPDKDDIK